MSENITTNTNSQELSTIIVTLWKQRRLIVKWCLVGAVLGLVIGFSIPKTYKSSVTFAPETEQKMGSGVSSIASMMGITLNNSIDAISFDMYPDVVHSTPFIVELFDIPVTFERKDSTITTSLVEYMKEYQKKPWWSHIMQAPFKFLGWCVGLVRPSDKEVIVEGPLDPTNLPKKEREIVKFFSDNIEVFIDKKTSKVSMSLELQDPKVVATVMDAVVSNLKTFMSDYRTSKARQDVINLDLICQQRKEEYQAAMEAYARFVDSNKSVVLQSAQVEQERLEQEMQLAYQVYSQVSGQLEGARIQEQQAKPVFVTIDPVTVPIRKSAPSKAKLLILFTFLAGCCAASWILFGEEYWRKIKESL